VATKRPKEIVMILDLANPKHTHADQRLRGEVILWLSTVRPDGRPHLVPVWFWWDGEAIFVFTQPASQKLRNLAANPAVTVALEAANEGEDIVMLEGTAEVLDDAARPGIIPAYVAKYDKAIAGLGWTPESMLADYSTLIRVTPSRLIVW
jgi:PPOX class probable F420-dependent enzyme